VANNEPTNAPTTATSPLKFEVGQKLAAGFYTLKRRLESDTIGPVWLASDEQSGKDVALHFLPEALLSDAPAIESVRQEVRRNRQLIHPHILRVHDFVQEPECLAICTDVADGETLAAVKLKKQNGFFEVGEINKWIAQLCATLEDAHKANLLHRDIGPANLIITRAGELMVTNFGISRAIMDAMSRLRPQFRFDAALAHMSPQQLDAERPSKLDDIYSVGALIYELLTSKPPFYTGDILPQVRKQVPPAMAQRRGELKINAQPIPEEWEKQVAECLAKQPEQRPKSALLIASKLAAADKAAAEAPAKPAPETKHTAQPAPKQERQRREKESKPAQPAPKKPAKEPQKAENAPVSPFSPVGPIFEMPGEQRDKAKFPAVGVAIALLLIAVGAAGYYFRFGASSESTAEATSLETTVEEATTAETKPEVEQPPVMAEASPAQPSPTPTPAAVVAATSPEPAQVGPAETPQDKQALGFFGRATQSIAAALSSKPAEEAAKAAAKEPPKEEPTPLPASAGPVAQAAQQAAIKARQLQQVQSVADEASRNQAEAAKQKEQAQGAAAEAQKVADEKARAVASAQQSAAQKETVRAQREEAQRKIEASLAAAQQAVAEQTRMLEEAKKAVADADSALKEQQNLQTRAVSEAEEFQKTAAEKQRVAAQAAQAAAKAEEERKLQAAALQKAEAEEAQARVAEQKVRAAEEARQAAEEAEKIRLARDQERQRLEQEALEAQRAAEEKMRLAQQARKAAEEAETLLKQRGIAKQQAEAAIKSLPLASAEATPAALPAPAQTPEAVLTPSPSPSPSPAEKPVQKVEKTLENSLGMKFAPVGNELFCIWQTRVRDFEAFAKATNFKGTIWRQPGFKQGPDHPVVNVSWNDAMAFCKWLTDKEQKEGLLSPSEYYRLPTDMEWSRAVGLTDEQGTSPEERDMDVPNVYPWGTQWPPPKGAGNYTGEETTSDVAIKGYDDGYQWTSPVGSFAQNQYGLYDMGGNVWQWVMDWWNTERKHKVLRGASWYNGALKLSLLSSCRVHAAPDSSTDNYGFRIVLASDGGKKSR
jgi:serine/threonine protein kinase/formylglycine-generating enzyme required for sulfatase activity